MYVFATVSILPLSRFCNFIWEFYDSVVFLSFHCIISLILVTLQEEFEETIGAIIICISKKNRQHNGQKKKYKRTKFGNRAQHSVPCRRTANS